MSSMMDGWMDGGGGHGKGTAETGERGVVWWLKR